MNERRIHEPILNMVFIIGAFLYFLSGGSLTFLVLSLIFLPYIFIEIYRIKTISFKFLLGGLVSVGIIQGIIALYIYLNISLSK